MSLSKGRIITLREQETWVSTTVISGDPDATDACCASPTMSPLVSTTPEGELPLQVQSRTQITYWQTGSPFTKKRKESKSFSRMFDGRILLRYAVMVVWLLGAMVFVPASTYAAPLNTDAIDAYIRAEIQNDQVPGVGVVIVKDAEIIYTRGFGQAREGYAVEPTTAFILGSMSKSFTAMAILQLVEQGRVDLDTAVHTYLPDFALADEQASAQITLRHLLHHTSGIPTYTPRPQNPNPRLADHIAVLQTVTPVSAPGSTYLYSSANYQILGRVVEVVSEETFGDYINRHIFTPLAMTHSYTDPVNTLPTNIASGYQYWFSIPRVSTLPYEDDRLPTAALTASAVDLGHYLIALLNAGSYKGQRVLSADSTRTLFTPAAPSAEDFSYAMGWRVGPVNGMPAIHHGGILPDFRGKMVILPEHGYAVAVLTNSSSFIGFPTSHRMADTIATMLVAGKPANVTLTLRTIQMAISIGIGLITIHEIVNLLRLPHWYNRLRSQNVTSAVPLKKEVFELVIGISISLITLLCLPGYLRMNWQEFIAQIPDIGWWLVIMLPLGILTNSVKLVLLARLPRKYISNST